MGVWRFAVSAVALAAVVDVGQSAPLQAVVAAEIAMGSLDPFHESIALGGQQIVWDADTEGCDRGISAPLLTVAHSGYAIEIYECDEVPKVVLLACALIGGATDTVCQKALLSDIHRALGDRLAGTGGGEHGATAAFYRRQQWRVAFVLEAMEATEAFNTVADAEGGPYSFTTDFVSANWPLAWAIAPLAHEAVRLLEVGSFEGRSAQLFRRLLRHPDSKLVCVDLWSMDPPHDYAEQAFRNNTADLAASGFLVEVMAGKPSNVALMDMAKHAHVRSLYPFDIAYIDGSHDAEAVLADMVMADAILRPGGLMLLDDLEWIGVQRAVAAFLSIKGDCCYEINHAARQAYLRKRGEHRPSHLSKNGRGAHVSEGGGVA